MVGKTKNTTKSTKTRASKKATENKVVQEDVVQDATVEAVVEATVEAPEQTVSTRKFKALFINPETGDVEMKGRYKGRKPKVSSSKALTKRCKVHPEYYGEEERAFAMQECTRSAKKKKRYFYVGMRVEAERADNDQPVEKNGQVIPYRFKNKIRKMKLSDMEGQFKEAYEKLRDFGSKAVEEEDEEVVQVVQVEQVVQDEQEQPVKKSTKSTKSNKSTKSTKATKTATKKVAPKKTVENTVETATTKQAVKKTRAPRAPRKTE